MTRQKQHVHEALDDMDYDTLDVLSMRDRIKTTLVLLLAPINISVALVKKPFGGEYARSKSWKRIAHGRALLTLVEHLDHKHLRAIFGSTPDRYYAFMRERRQLGLASFIEDVKGDTGAQLCWIGGERRERAATILYFHGGAFLFSAAAPDYWRFIQQCLEKRGVNTDCAMMSYALVPEKMFPFQLKQAVLAIQHIIEGGVDPHKIVLVGDSAGGALIHELLSHMLHPVEGVPKLEVSEPLGGAYLMSPWSQLRDVDGCLSKYDHKGDVLTGTILGQWGNIVLEGVSEAHVPYIEANSAPKTWYEGVDNCVGKVLLSAGGVECLRDEIVKQYESLKVWHKGVEIYIQDYGVHDDPYWDVALGDRRVRDLTQKIVDWMIEVL